MYVLKTVVVTLRAGSLPTKFSPSKVVFTHYVDLVTHFNIQNSFYAMHSFSIWLRYSAPPTSDSAIHQL